MAQTTLSSRDEAAAFLARLNARYVREKSTAFRWVYWAGSQRLWYAVQNRGGRWIISAYRSCPC